MKSAGFMPTHEFLRIYGGTSEIMRELISRSL